MFQNKMKTKISSFNYGRDFDFYVVVIDGGYTSVMINGSKCLLL